MVGPAPPCFTDKIPEKEAGPGRVGTLRGGCRGREENYKEEILDCVEGV